MGGTPKIIPNWDHFSIETLWFLGIPPLSRSPYHIASYSIISRQTSSGVHEDLGFFGVMSSPGLLNPGQLIQGGTLKNSHELPLKLVICNPPIDNSGC